MYGRSKDRKGFYEWLECVLTDYLMVLIQEKLRGLRAKAM